MSVDAVVESYRSWLEVKAPEHLKAFKQRLDVDPEAARAEAVTFNVLRVAGVRPTPGEVIGKGGSDFICNKPEMVVEVTSISIDTVTKASGLKHPMSGMGGFSQITRNLLREAINKATQLADYPMPRLLVIATEHSGGSLLMNAHSAQELLTGTTSFSIPIGGPAADITMVTQLANSVFCRPTNEGKVEPSRRSISAVVLMTISQDIANVIGLLHPDPAVPFDPNVLSNVHFLRFRSWPLEAGKPFGVEWVGPQPSPTPFPHFPVELMDAELRTLD